MAEPAREYPQDIEPEIRPNLRAIDGGAGTSGKSTANLRSVDPSETARSLEEREAAGSNVIQGPWGKSPADINSAESQPPAIINNVTGKGAQSKLSFKARVLGNKKALWGVGIGGTIGSLLIAAFLALLPLKLEMFIQNITKQAAALPAHAVERRAEYLVTRALATRLIQKTNGLTDLQARDLVFCKKGAIACSLFNTYTSKYLEDKLGIMIDQPTGNTIRITPKDRSSLGGKARNWTVETGTVDENGLFKTISSIESSSNGEIKKLLTKQIEKNSRLSNIVTRFIGRRILMKKYGVTNWRGFEKTSNKISELRTAFSAAVYKNTIGRILPRTAMYLACLSGGGATCDKVIKDLSANVDPSNPNAQKIQDWANKLKGVNAGEAPADNILTKVISSRVTQALGGAVAIAGIADMGFKAIGAIDNGALDQIANDINKSAYVGLAFGTESGLAVNNEKMKAGDVDIDVLGVATSYLDGAEQSPLMQAENGITTADSTTQVTRDCQASQAPSTTGAPSPDAYTYKPTTLAPGELVCPEAKLVRGYATEFRKNTSWAALANVADVWNHSPVGAGFSFFNDIFGQVFGTLTDVISKIPGVSWVAEQTQNLLAPVMNWLVSLIFNIPNIGPKAPGANNYDALSGGIRAEQNELMEQGVDEAGRANGGGGKVMTNVQVAAIMQQQQAADADYYNSQPVMARIFNPMLTGSFAQRFVAAMPTSFSSLGMLPAQSLQSVFGASSASAATVNTAIVNPMGLPLYGYANDDPALTASSDNYDETTCAASAKAREASYGHHPEISPIATYTMTDPCALEKQSVGALLIDANVTNDKYSLPDLEVGTNAGGIAGGPLTNSGNIKDSGWAWPAPKGTNACGFDCYAGHNGMDILDVQSGTDIYAARDGVVIAAGPDQYMTAAACYAATSGSAPYNGTQYTVIIRHDINGQRVDTLYTHLLPDGIHVTVGQTVKAGDRIAQSGNTGCTTGPHLHFGIYDGGYPKNPIDPTTILGRSG